MQLTIYQPTYAGAPARYWLGYLPQRLSEYNPEPAAKQLDVAYAHGGGWDPFKGFSFDPKSGAMTYPGDPPMYPICELAFREERIVVYPHEWIAIVQKDNSFEICRMD